MFAGLYAVFGSEYLHQNASDTVGVRIDCWGAELGTSDLIDRV